VIREEDYALVAMFWKKTFVAYFYTIFQYSHGRSEENREKPVRRASNDTEI
jgi:hypothetical protein